jgi:hypothetical protein
MKVITLRNIPPDVAREITAKAQQRGTSASRTIVKILEEYFSVGGNGETDGLHHDLDDLAGAWPAEQAAAFDESLKEQRAIDSDAWQ